MRDALALLVRAVVRGTLTAHVGGALLFTLLVLVERAQVPTDELLSALRTEVPTAWARAATVLGLVGVTLAVTRMRRQGVVLGLGTLGVDARLLLLVGALAGAASGALSTTVPIDAPVPGDWERGDGGWIRDGQAWPDTPADTVYHRPPPTPPVAAEVTNGALAGGLGAALGLWAGAPATVVAGAVLLVSDVVARGLVDRAALPALARATPGLLALVWALILQLRAPIFPRRWG